MNTKFFTKWHIIALLGVFFANIFIFSTVTSATSLIEAQALDTIAGYSTNLQSSIGMKNKDLVFTVEKPDGSVINVFSKTNPEGRAESEFYGYHTKLAGIYKIYTYLKTENIPDHYTTFRVYPDSPSPIKSTIIASPKSNEASGKDFAYIRVHIRDKHNNPVKDHQVNLISSRNDDVITALEPKTDENGEIIFKVASEIPGISTFIVTDITTNIVLHDRAKVVFYEPDSNENAGIGNSYLFADLLSKNTDEDTIDELFNGNSSSDDSSGDNDPFDDLLDSGSDSSGDNSGDEFDDLLGDDDSTTESDESLSDFIDDTYTTTPSNNQLFGEISTFEIQIPDTIILNQEADIKVIAVDQNGRTVKDYLGKISFAVITDDNATLPSDYTFKNTDQGEKLFSLAVKFSRLGKHTIEVFDKNYWDISSKKEVEIVKETGPGVPDDGKKAIQIQSPTEGLETGQNVITISGKGPPNINIKIFDNDFKIGDSETDSNGLFSFQAINLQEGNHSFYILESGGKGRISNTVNIKIDISGASIHSFAVIPEGPIEVSSHYTVRVTSEPTLDEVSIVVNSIKEKLEESTFQAGTYEGSFIAPDKPGNYEIKVILVDEFQNRTDFDPHHPLQVVSKKADTPPQVIGLRGEAGNKKVELSWDAVLGHTRPVRFYKIYTGLTKDVFERTVNTAEANTSYEIKNLENGTTYYFAVSAIDNAGNESDIKSLTIDVIPEKKKINLGAVPNDSQITLTWDTFEDFQASKYIIYYGTRSNDYKEFIKTEDDKTTYVVPNLINGVSYYFRVVPVDQFGNEKKMLYTEEDMASPVVLGTTLPSAPKIEPYIIPVKHKYPPRGKQGPSHNVFFIIVMSLMFGSSIMAMRKRLKKF